MENLLQYVLRSVSEKNPLHGKKIKKNKKKYDAEFIKRADKFLTRYNLLLKTQSKNLDYSIDCYLQMLADVNYESVQFFQTGKYSSSSFEEVNQRVYANPEVMEYYMHGLLLSQFLWPHHYDILLHFNELITKNAGNIKTYLEIGGGHGLYISEAINNIKNNATYDLVDISKSSLNIAKQLIGDNSVNYIHSDIYAYFPKKKYDFITMGEVMEHVEDPLSLLKKLNTLLNQDGKVFVTTPTNAPAIDHIYLFNNAEEIRSIIHKAGFQIENEFCIYSEDVTKEIADKFKISMMYTGLLTKNNKK